MPNGRKYWVFTWNNPPEQVDQMIKTAWEDSGVITYLVYQHEIAPTTGTHHLQGYVVFNKRIARPTTILGDGGHYIGAKGKPMECRAYCTKEESRHPDYAPVEFGECPETAQGTRSDILEIKEKVDQGVPTADIWDQHFSTMSRVYRAVNEYKRVKAAQRDFQTETTLIVGPTGTGKSHYARMTDPNAYYKQSSQWWDGYEGQETVILDDFYGWLPYSDMLNMMDKYPMMVQIKGGQTQFLAKRVIITSNALPATWYPKVFSVQRYASAAFSRRITCWIFMGTLGAFKATSLEDFEAKSAKYVTLLE